MKRRKVSEAEQPFLDHVRQLEEHLFESQLHETEKSFMKNDGRPFWHFRPSHHMATGLVTQADIALLMEPGKRLLSIGAFPAYLERVLVELGVPSRNILIADNDPAVRTCEQMQSVVFDANEPWPDIGSFDFILFPESLCTAIGDRMRAQGMAKESASDDHHTDALEAQLLASIVRQALARLRPGGVIRANGPMSHPNVMRAMIAALREEGYALSVESRRFFLSIRVEE